MHSSASNARPNRKMAGQNPLDEQPPYNHRRLPEDVWTAEREYLHQRRSAAGNEPNEPTVGLALSGGGIRSASFNLGFVQALMARGKFKNVDYLSTVSGGGYLGGFLGARMAYLCQGDDSTPDSKPPSKLDYQRYVVPKKTGEQTDSVKRLLRSGRYLKRVPHFINRYLFGVAITNLWLFFGLAALGAGTAGLFRLIDSRIMVNAAKAAGFGSDISRAFVPAVVCFLLWITFWGIRYVVQAFRRTEFTPHLDLATRILAILMLVLIALAIVSVLVTQDIALPVWSSAHGAAPEFTDAVHRIAIVLVVVQIIALLPLFRLDKLIQSGSRPRGLRDSLIFNIVGPAMVFGIPLLAFGWFAKENVSGAIGTARLGQTAEAVDITVDQRDPSLLCFPHIPDWEGFWTMVQQRAAAGRSLEKKLLEAANTQKVQDSIENAKAYRESLENVYPLIGIGDGGTKHELYVERDEMQRQIVNSVNRDCLFDAGLFRDVKMSDPPSSQDARAFPDWLLRAKALSRMTTEKLPLGEVANVNRQTLQAYFGSHWIRPPDTVFALTTLWADKWDLPLVDHRRSDQRYRFFWFCTFTVLWVAVGLLINPNYGSLQEFYRERLQYMWLPRRKIAGDERKRVVLSAISQPDDRPMHDFPYLLINATAHVFRGDIGTFLGGEPNKMPRQARFEFAPAFCGYSVENPGGDKPTYLFQPTNIYERQLYLDLPGIMAISGSAVSPAMTDNFVVKTLLFLSNFRLGQWVQQPGSVGDRPKYPKILPCLGQVVLPLRSSPKFLFLSDGGHYDNLGLEALLDRRVEQIICVDAGHDPQGCFTDLLKVVRRSRFLDGIRIKTTNAGDLAFAELERVKGSVAKAHYFKASIAYPDGTEGTLYYVKPSFDLDEPAELITYRDENPDFPHDPTLDQFYDERRFESYRALGWHIGEKLADALERDAQPSLILSDGEPVMATAASKESRPRPR